MYPSSATACPGLSKLKRRALVELDVLALGLAADERWLIYRIQFPVLQQYERETYYDQRGIMVFTTNRGLSGVALDRKDWEQIKDAQSPTNSTTSPPNTSPLRPLRPRNRHAPSVRVLRGAVVR